jgi:hypothetical protein
MLFPHGDVSSMRGVWSGFAINGGAPKVIFSCPKCMAIGTIHPNDVIRSGHVAGMLTCDKQCGWDDSDVQLDRWKNPAVPG